MAADENIIEIVALNKCYGSNKVVDGIDLQVKAGECFVMVGQNGAGKTTLMKLMLGLSRPEAGQVKVLGCDPASRKFFRNRMQLGYLPESVSFYAQMTGLEILRYYARLKLASESEVNRLLQLVGLKEAEHQRLNTYSKGMRQRLGLAQAMLGSPKLLFLDEPTTGLDPILRRDFYQILNELRAAGTTIVISSHALNEVEVQADRIGIIKQGKLAGCGSLTELAKQTSLKVAIQLEIKPGSLDHVVNQLQEHAAVGAIHDHRVDLQCDEADKMLVMQKITNLWPVVNDIRISEPGLVDIYLYYVEGVPN